MSSAGLVHSISRGCSTGRLDRCTCDESKNLQNEEAWRWGGCGDNIKFGLKFTRRFLKRAKRNGKDVLARVNRHNSHLGIKVCMFMLIRQRSMCPWSLHACLLS